MYVLHNFPYVLKYGRKMLEIMDTLFYDPIYTQYVLYSRLVFKNQILAFKSWIPQMYVWYVCHLLLYFTSFYGSSRNELVQWISSFRRSKLATTTNVSLSWSIGFYSVQQLESESSSSSISKWCKLRKIWHWHSRSRRVSWTQIKCSSSFQFHNSFWVPHFNCYVASFCVLFTLGHFVQSHISSASKSCAITLELPTK